MMTPQRDQEQQQEYDSYYNLKSDIVDMLSKQGAERRRQIQTHRRMPIVSSASTVRPAASVTFAEPNIEDVEEQTEVACSDSDDDSDDWATETVLTTRQFDPVDTSEGGAGRRHGGYGLVTFCSEDEQTAWHDHPSTFTRESLLFAMLFAHKKENEDEDPCKVLGNLERLNYRPFLHFKLKGISDTDFESFLLALRPRLGQSLPHKRLPAILSLSTKWDFPNLRNYALDELPDHISNLLTPVDAITLARETKVPQWLLDPHIKLATRPAPLSLHEARIVGVDGTLAISRARERILSRRLSLITGPPPAMLFGYSLWTHPKCWYTLSEAWRIGLTDKRYRDVYQSTRELIAAVLDDAKLAHAQDYNSLIGRLVSTITVTDDGGHRTTANLPKIGKLCSSCDDLSKIEGWIGMKEDEKIAKNTLKDVLSEEEWVNL